MNLGLVNLPSYSPDFNADEAIWGWARQEATANQCLGTRAAVREKVGSFFTGLTQRHEEVKRRCRTVLQAKADELIGDAQANPLRPANVDFHRGFGLVSAQISIQRSWGLAVEVPMLAATSGCGEVQQPCRGSDTP